MGKTDPENKIIRGDRFCGIASEMPGVRASIKVLCVVWALAILLTLAVGAVSILSRTGIDVDAAMVQILRLDTLVTFPSGTVTRTPGLAHPAIVLQQVPAAWGLLGNEAF
jgi:hypothetical protein